MSWDVIIMKFNEHYDSVADIPDNAKGLVLGTEDQIRSRITEYFPGTDWSDNRWGIWEENIGSIEFNLGSDPEIDSIGLHVRASNEVVKLITKFIRESEWIALDTTMGEILSLDDGNTEGIDSFNDYKSRVIENLKDPS